MMRRSLLGLAWLAATGTVAAQTSVPALYSYATLHTADGAGIFRNICQGCHMPDAKGATGAGSYPPLAGNPKLASAQYMAAVVLFGRHDMPSFVVRPSDQRSFFKDATLTDEQVAEVVNYVRTHFGNHYRDSLSAADVAAMHAPAASSKTPPQ